MKRIIYGGRGKGKMMALEEFIKLLPEEQRKNIIIAKHTDDPSLLRGNKLPRIIRIDIDKYKR